MILDIGLAVRMVTAIRANTATIHGCPEWDPAGVRSMLTSTDGSPGAVLAAALLAAEDHALSKPSAAALVNHWPVNAKASPSRVPQLDLCPEHGEPRAECSRHEPKSPCPPDVRAAILAAARDGRDAIHGEANQARTRQETTR